MNQSIIQVLLNLVKKNWIYKMKWDEFYSKNNQLFLELIELKKTKQINWDDFFSAAKQIQKELNEEFTKLNSDN